MNGNRESAHNVDAIIQAITKKLHALEPTLARADEHFSLDIYKKGPGYDVKLNVTS